MSETLLMSAAAAMRGREIVLTDDDHELCFLPAGDSTRALGLRWDGAEVRPAVVAFATWDDAGEAEIDLTPEAAELVGAGTIELTVTNDALEVFNLIYDMIDAAGDLPPMDDAELADYAETA